MTTNRPPDADEHTPDDPDPRDPSDAEIEQLDPDAPGSAMFRRLDDEENDDVPEPNEPG